MNKKQRKLIEKALSTLRHAVKELDLEIDADDPFDATCVIMDVEYDMKKIAKALEPPPLGGGGK